jgi:hypothetical protein
MRIRESIVGLMFCAMIGCGVVWSQANVNESLETVFLYVDVAAGSDSNPGTQALPFKTIGKAASVAVANNRKGLGTRVIINPGTYREGITLGTSTSDTTLPITFQAVSPGTAMISGADVWGGWQPLAADPRVYTHPWSYTWGLCPREATGPFLQDITLRREMIRVNGAMLTQVLSLPQLVRGTFFVDEPNAVVYIFPAIGTDISTSAVEVATRDFLFSAFSKTNIVLRGLTFENANTCRNNETVQFIGGSHILIDRDSFNWNNAGGVGFNKTTFFSVRNSFANHNGERGFDSFEAKNGVWASDEGDYDNWRGAQGGIYGWGGGGFHFFAQHSNSVTGAKMFFNMTHGVHWDTDDADVTAGQLVSAFNLRDGVFIEKSQGPVSVANSTVCNNSLLGLYFDGGLALRTSTNVTLNANRLVNNTGSQLPIIGIQGGVPIAVSNYETGQNYNLLTSNLTMTSNTFLGGTGQQLFNDFDQGGSAWQDFQTTLVSDHNTWWSDSVSQPFIVPVPKFFTALDFGGWRSVSGQDTHSVFTRPAGNPAAACQVTPDAPDFWFVNQDQGVVKVTAGSPAVYTLLLIPVGSFNGKAAFSQHGVSLVPGATIVGWSNKSLTGSGVTTFTLNTSPTTPAGMYLLTFSAHFGNVARTVTVSLIVQ